MEFSLALPIRLVDIIGSFYKKNRSYKVIKSNKKFYSQLTMLIVLI